ncbi:acyl-CoA dehydrogenase family protein [Nocardia jiangsuensis]|uniref:Acyl-[acyl-carrier-protein] dehydrogenase MbtN n=1 Tax=Nocardia jiangsuensis TaxID=1691563 RepID=A0ABV8E0H8_9NOCA
MTTIRAAEPSTFDRVLDAAFDEALLEVIERAEHGGPSGLFPRELIENLGSAGVFAGIWPVGAHADMASVVRLSERLGGLGSASAAAGVSAHNTALAILRRFGRSDYLRELADRATRGDAVVGLGATEAGGGSDFAMLATTAEPTAAGFRVRGSKKFVSLSTVADAIVVVARAAGSHRDGGVTLFALRSDQIHVGRPYAKLGNGYLDTAPVEFDVEVPEEAMIARPGTGLAAASAGLVVERMSVAGLVVGACDLAIGVAVAQMMRRSQFGQTLFEHQALRLRFADLQARVDTVRYALKGLTVAGPVPFRAAAGMKVTAARLGEEVMSECLHIFGGEGYLTGPAPIEKWWRDMKLARVAAGGDEVLWETVASGMRPDLEAHERWVRS